MLNKPQGDLGEKGPLPAVQMWPLKWRQEWNHSSWTPICLLLSWWLYAEFSRVSLEAYEAKLAIHDKYRDQELTLTEYEKDLALKRYLTKVGRDRKDKVDHTININHEAEKLDDTLDKPDDIIPNLPLKPNLFRKRFILGAFTAALISTIALIANAGVGFIILGVWFSTVVRYIV